jgi:hypothetical protein
MILTARVKIHNVIAKFAKLGTQQWFGKEIGDHVRSRAVFDRNTLGVHLVLNKKN